MKQKLSPAENRKAWLVAALIVLMMLAAGAGVYLLITHAPQEPPFLPPERAFLTEAAQDMDDVCVYAFLDPDAQRLVVSQELRLRNRTGQMQEAVVLRSWSGAYLKSETSPAASDELFYECYGAAFDAGGLSLTSALVDGRIAAWRWLDDESTVLSVPAEWAPETTVTVTLHYIVDVPDCASRFGHAETSGQRLFMLGNVFPTAAVWQDGAWDTDPYAAIGDPFVSECANWDVTLKVPEGWTAAASVWAEPEADNGQWTYRFTGSALRDFALVVGNNLICAQGMADGVLVTAFAHTLSDAQTLLRYARQAISSYTKRWGEYAYPTFTVTEAFFPYGGMEYPGLAMIASDVLDNGGETLEYIVAHETAHQWWSVMVGSDGWYQPWQDEALCEYAYLAYVGDWYGEGDRERKAFDRIETSLRITIPGRVTPGSPIDHFSSLTEYSLVTYQRGAALWRALELHMGREELDAALREYQMLYRFRIASREELTEVINRHAGQDMSGLMLDYLDTLMQ